MPALSEHTNVENTAMVILSDKGYQIWRDNESELLHAEKNGWDFLAESAVALLGLIAIYEHKPPKEFSDYWWRIRDPWIRDKLPSKSIPFKSVMTVNDDDNENPA